ncbi:MAG TPA: DUF3300 domain-containing protein [Bryobacteraceae bacterium]|nr:DUF3300 domain-containing protein [Bryobacteraceae bacterium]
MRLVTLTRFSIATLTCCLAFAQPPLMSPKQLDRLVDRIALYPDSLLAQVLAAATYPDQIPDADMWANQHRYLHGDELARAIEDDRVPWDPAVQALLPFPDVLHMMNSDFDWMRSLGEQYMQQQAAVMDAVERDRQKAYDFGYLRSGPYLNVVVTGPHLIAIDAVNPALLYVPVYNPAVVFVAPRPGFVVGGAISFGPMGIALGAAFAPWGWGAVHIGWATHEVIIHGHPWGRTWANRGTYVHPYAARRWAPAERREGHRLEEHHDRGRGRR